MHGGNDVCWWMNEISKNFYTSYSRDEHQGHIDIHHTSRFYIVNPKGYWVGSYKPPFIKRQIATDLDGLLNSKLQAALLPLFLKPKIRLLISLFAALLSNITTTVRRASSTFSQTALSPLPGLNKNLISKGFLHKTSLLVLRLPNIHHQKRGLVIL